MSDLHRAVKDEIDAFRPDRIPPFGVLVERHRSRNRRRKMLTVAAPALIAVLVAPVAWSAITDGSDSLEQQAAPAPDPDIPIASEQTRYSLTYADAETYQRHEQAVGACVALPGVSDVQSLFSLPPSTTVTVTGMKEAQDFEACFAPLDGVTLAPVTEPTSQEPDPFAPSETRYSVRYDGEAVYNRQVDAVQGCLDLPGVSVTGQRESLPPVVGVEVLGFPEDRAFQDCMSSLSGVTLTALIPYDPTTAPDAFINRSSLPSCGQHVVGHGPVPRGAIDCFADALGSPAGAEYAVSRLTEEGDPVVVYYRALPGQQAVEVFIDSTRDNFGSQNWLQATCTGYDVSTGQATGCPPNGNGQI